MKTWIEDVAGKSVTEEEIERCVAEVGFRVMGRMWQADKNGNGIIEYDEFIAA